MLQRVDIVGELLTLDLGVRTGFCVGAPGSAPRSSYVDLKYDYEERGVAFGNLIGWLRARITTRKPGLIIKEKMLPLPAFKKMGSGQSSVNVTAGLHAIVEGLCHRYGIRFVDVADSTVRKHFIGYGRAGTRKATKRAVVKEAQLRGLMPFNCNDDNRADACAMWDFGIATYARRRL